MGLDSATRKRRSIRGPRLGATLLGALWAMTMVAGTDQGAGIQPQRAAWRVLTFKASKLGISTTADVALEEVPAATAGASLGKPHQGEALQPNGETTRVLTIGHSFLGQTTTTRVWFDPADARALQRLHVETGRQHRRKTYRYTRQGVAYHRRSPDDGEERLPFERWKHSGRDFYPFPPSVAGTPVIEPATLFYIASASALARPGDSVRLAAFTRKRISTIVATVSGTTPIPVAYTEVSGAGERAVSGRVEALRLSLRAESMSGDPDEQLELIGLQGELALYLEPRTRIPLQLSGSFKLIGDVDVKLERVVLGR